MKPVSRPLAVAVGAALFASPAALFAQDDLEDLEVTMEVVDDARELDDVISEMRGPDVDVDDYGYDYDDGMEGDGQTRELMGSEGGLGGTSADLGREAVPYQDTFEGDQLASGNDGLEDSDQAFRDEVDFEEEEHVDQDEYDELDDLYDDDGEMDDEPLE